MAATPEQPGDAAEPSDLPRSPGPSFALPAPLTSLVGRHEALAAVGRWLNDATGRLLTLTGTAGSGKTRMALEAAQRVGDDRDVYWVSLAEVFDHRLVADVVANTIGLARRDQQALPALQRFLAGRRALIVLDNFEQVIEAAPALVQLLQGCQRLQLLVTSREFLRVRGETVLDVPPLSLPTAGDRPDHSAIEVANRSEAVQLFVERTRSLRADYRLTPANVDAVVRICVQLDGLPLAVELAAAAMRHLDEQTLLARIGTDDRRLGPSLRDLPPRQRTLHHAIGWSYELLEEAERTLFRRLTVFAGGWTAESCASVCRDGVVAASAAAATLEALVRKNMVLVGAVNGGMRYQLLETLREFGLERLRDCGEEPVMRQRHAAYFAALCATGEPHVDADDPLWLTRLTREAANIRAAMEWLLEQPAEREQALRLAGAAAMFWRRLGHAREMRIWCERALEGSDGCPPDARARVWRHISVLGVSVERSFDVLGRADRLHRQAGDLRGLAWTQYLLGLRRMSLREAELARRHLIEAQELFQRVVAAPDAIYSDRSGYGYCLLRLANLAHAAADTAQATRCAEQALEAFTPLGEQRGLAMAHSVLAQTTWTAEQTELAARHRDQAFRAVSALPMIGTIEDTVFALIDVEIAHGRPHAATQLIGSWHSAFEASYGEVILNDYASETIDRVRGQMPAAGYQRAWSRGRAIPLADSVESLRAPAAEQPEPATARTGAADRWQLLSRREREVVRLIAGGKADKEIAAELGVSVSTAYTHVRNILRRTGCRNRAEAATLAPPLPE